MLRAEERTPIQIAAYCRIDTFCPEYHLSFLQRYGRTPAESTTFAAFGRIGIPRCNTCDTMTHQHPPTDFFFPKLLFSSVGEKKKRTRRAIRLHHFVVGAPAGVLSYHPV